MKTKTESFATKFEDRLFKNIEMMIDYDFGTAEEQASWKEALACNMDEYFSAYISGAPMESIVEAITGMSIPDDVFLE